MVDAVERTAECGELKDENGNHRDGDSSHQDYNRGKTRR